MHPELGSDGDFDAMVAAAEEAGIEVQLDFAIQCSPDHPWLREHPDWFQQRPDGTIKFAENPPKRYQDIYNLNWETNDREALWSRCGRSCCTGAGVASGRSGSTTRTRSRRRSGNG